MNIIIQNCMTRPFHTSSETAIITLTEKSVKSAKKIEEIFENSSVFVMKKHEKSANSLKKVIFYENLSTLMSNIFSNYENLIFIMATGITIRHIAPYVRDKMSDPAIIVCDEKLQFAISLLSGHIGGANEICRYMSRKLNITPVITTSTDVNGKSALDTLALELNSISEDDRGLYKKINYKLTNDEKVYLLSDVALGELYDLRGFTLADEDFAFQDDDCIVHFTYRDVTGYEKLKNYNKIHLKKIVLGIGCKKNTPSKLMIENVQEQLKKYNISAKSVFKIGSIDIKSEERAIIDLANALNADFVVFNADEIRKSSYYNDLPKNDFVESITGVSSVSLPVTKILTDDNIIGETFKGDGMTITIGLCKN